MSGNAWTVAVCACCFGGMAAGQPVGAENLREFWAAAGTRRVDVVQIGDSTQLFGGHGWDEGWNRGLHDRFGLYATGVHSAGENAGNGAGVGWECTTMASASQHQFLYAGAPAEVDATCQSTLIPLGYLYVPPGSTANSNSNSGMALSAASPLGVNGPLRFHYRFGRFATVNAGTFRPVVRLDVPPYTNLSPLISIGTDGQPGLNAGFIDVPAAVRDAPVAFRWAQAGGPAISGPFFGSWMRVERVDKAAGAAVSALYAAGSKTTRDGALALMNVNDQTLVTFFSVVRSLQPAPARVLIRVSFGVNDRNMVAGSVGTGGYSPGNSGAAFGDNTRAIISRIEQLWTAQGWELSELFFVISPSAPIAEPDDPFLLQYRDAADAVAASLPRVASVRFDRLTNDAEMAAKGWYNASFDHIHLSRAGFVALSDREIGALMSGASTMAMPWRTLDGGGVTVSSAGTLSMSATIAQPDAGAMENGSLAFWGGFWGIEGTEYRCPADYNHDGGIDGADVQVFFMDWEGGLARADVNQDGGVDGADVEAFYAIWEVGSC